MPFEMSRADYHARYGLTTGDMLRLGDTNLYIRPVSAKRCAMD